jgi:Holliday junction resolvasome RuvABC endonuclease subunit
MALTTPTLLIIGCDPGTGVNSPLGLTVIDPHRRILLHAEEFWTEHKVLHHRIKDISDRLELVLLSHLKEYPTTTFHFFVESFVMRGKGGETLQRMIGSVMGRVPYEFDFGHVQNSTVKLLMAEHGHASKEEVAKSVQEFFGASNEKIEELIAAQKWDIIDAAAIAISGWFLNKSGATPTKKSKRNGRTRAAAPKKQKKST